MSTGREGADPITPSTPDREEATPTPVAHVTTRTTPDETTTWVDTKGDLVTLNAQSDAIDALLMLEAGPARELVDDLEAAIAEVEEAGE